VRGAPAAAGELTDAVEPGEQGLAVKRYRGRCSIGAGIQHQPTIEQLGLACKGMGSDSLCKRLHVGARPSSYWSGPAPTGPLRPRGCRRGPGGDTPAAPAIPMSYWLSRRHLRFAPARAYIAAMDRKFWKKALREAERELDAATSRTTLNVAAKKLMRAKAELKRLEITSGTTARSPATLTSAAAFRLRPLKTPGAAGSPTPLLAVRDAAR
jgi:hypothetical protein